MKTTVRIIVMLMLFTVTVPPTRSISAAPQSRVTATMLMQELSRRARILAQRNRQNGQSLNAAIWLGWANLYSNIAAQLSPRLPAIQLLKLNIQYCRQVEKLAATYGVNEYSSLYGASADFWESIVDQLSDDVTELKISFPSEMLRVIPGAPGTPWENLGRSFGRGSPGGGYSVPSSPCGASGYRICFQCKGDGIEDYSAFANPYSEQEKYEPSKYRFTCRNCHGNGKVRCR